MQHGATSLDYSAAGHDGADTSFLPAQIAFVLGIEGWLIVEGGCIAARGDETAATRQVGHILLHEDRGIALVDVVMAGTTLTRHDANRSDGACRVPVAYCRIARAEVAMLPVLLGRILPLHARLDGPLLPRKAHSALLRALGLAAPRQAIEERQDLAEPSQVTHFAQNRHRAAQATLLGGSGLLLALALVLSGSAGSNRRSSNLAVETLPGSAGWIAQNSAGTAARDSLAGASLPAMNVEAGRTMPHATSGGSVPMDAALGIVALLPDAGLDATLPTAELAVPPPPELPLLSAPPPAPVPLAPIRLATLTLPADGIATTLRVPPGGFEPPYLLAPGADLAQSPVNLMVPASQPPSAPALLTTSETFAPLDPPPGPVPSVPVISASLPVPHLGKDDVPGPGHGPAVAAASLSLAATAVMSGTAAAPRGTAGTERPARRPVEAAATRVAAPIGAKPAGRDARGDTTRCAALLRRLQLGEGPSLADRMQLRTACGPG